MAKAKEQTLDALGAWLGHFHWAATEGIRDQLEKYPDTGHIHRLMTKRNIARDHIVDRLRGALDGEPGIKIDDKNQTTYFRLQSKFCMLVKKADELGYVGLTGSQTAFDFQANEQLAFDSEVIPEVTNLYLSYVPNEDDPRNPLVLLVCPTENGAEWVHEIPPPAASEVVEIAPALPPIPSVDDGDLVRIPRSEEEETDAG